MFITLEGIEASGKSTQILRLKHALEQAGRTVVCTREPGGTPASEAMRTVLLTHSETMPLLAQAMLANAARAAHVGQVIHPALARGVTVLCDRFMDSTLVYQGYAPDAPAAFLAQLRTLNYLASDGLIPDRTLLLDIPVEVALARQEARGGASDGFERQGLAFWQRARMGFLRIAAEHPARCFIIDASAPEEDVAAAIAHALGLGTPSAAR